MFVVLISRCIVWIGIRVKEQTAELVDINWLDLLVVVVINSSFGSVLCLCRLVNVVLLITELNICLYVGKVTHRKSSNCIALLTNLLPRIILSDMNHFQNLHISKINNLGCLYKRQSFILLPDTTSVHQKVKITEFWFWSCWS